MLRVALLQKLSQTLGYAVPQDVLFAEMFAVSRMTTKADVETALRALEADGYVAGTTNKLTGQTKWSITDEGKLALANA